MATVEKTYQFTRGATSFSQSLDSGPVEPSMRERASSLVKELQEAGFKVKEATQTSQENGYRVTRDLAENPRADPESVFVELDKKTDIQIMIYQQPGEIVCGGHYNWGYTAKISQRGVENVAETQAAIGLLANICQKHYMPREIQQEMPPIELRKGDPENP